MDCHIFMHDRVSDEELGLMLQTYDTTILTVSLSSLLVEGAVSVVLWVDEVGVLLEAQLCANRKTSSHTRL